ncbi:MAG: ankyrin repeat domain-containing protein [Candidatus Omnitrophica bacterium]|nr:ankyrin repeat domain-containing protein [Candidatus Omnitrophota bacterium]MCA9424039.1 ankyrin repeat domain-containing protein [Candidatus Omnitrophota bacterium]MCA9433821.1 ankyrin repeat domain-containing protein [Candidatus Omnitrophota bacterium]MCA9437418.1 ankyrin repeat domain-containing protein [Candidatus Omnitrophota bacterium]MCB9769356.1 ankyrin repeat domain-containing protein [Candidatus Omnitrophota bacterium]
MTKNPSLVHSKPEGMGLLHSAVYLNQAEMVELILEAGADPNLRQDHLQLTPLIIAVQEERPSIVAVLLEYGADPNLRCAEDSTALHRAAFLNDALSARMLLEAGADPKAKDAAGLTPLEWAIHEERQTSLGKIGGRNNEEVAGVIKEYIQGD